MISTGQNVDETKYSTIPLSWNRTTKLRQERISQRLAENEEKSNRMDIEAIQARRSRLEQLMKSKQSQNRSQLLTSSTSSDISSTSRKNQVKLKPVEVVERRLPSVNRQVSNNTCKKSKMTIRPQSPVMNKKKNSKHRSRSEGRRASELLSTFEEMTLDEWKSKRVMGDDVRRSSLHDVPATPHTVDQMGDEKDSTEKENTAMNGNKIFRGKNNESYKEFNKGNRDHNLLNDEIENKISEKIVKEIIRELRGRTESEKLRGAERARKHLSIENNPPFDLFIRAGVIPALVSCLSSYSPHLQFESAWALTNITSGNTEQAMAVYEGGAIQHFILLLSSPYNYVADQCVWAVGNLVGDCSFMWQTVVDEGAIKPLYTAIQKNPSLASFRNLSWTFGNIVRHKPLNLSNSDFSYCLKAIRLFLHHPDKEIHVNACWSLVHITDIDNEKIKDVIDAGVLPRIIEELFDCEDKRTITPAVRVVGNVMTGTDKQTDQAIEAGAIPVLIRHLEHPSFTVRKDCAWALSNITAGTQEQIQKLVNANLYPQIYLTITKDDGEVRKEAIWCVSNLSQSGSSEQIDECINKRLLEALLKNVEKNPKPSDKQLLQITLEGIKNIITKTTSPKNALKIVLRYLTLDDVKRLTYAEDETISRIAVKIHTFITPNS